MGLCRSYSSKDKLSSAELLLSESLSLHFHKSRQVLQSNFCCFQMQATAVLLLQLNRCLDSITWWRLNDYCLCACTIWRASNPMSVRNKPAKQTCNSPGKSSVRRKELKAYLLHDWLFWPALLPTTLSQIPQNETWQAAIWFAAIAVQTTRWIHEFIYFKVL